MTQKTLLELALDEDWQVRMEAAGSDELTLEVAEILCSDEDDDVRCVLADNPKTPECILERMASDTCLLVKMNLAQNPNTPHAGLRAIYQAHPDNADILWSLATHTRLEGSVRDKITATLSTIRY